MIQCGLLTFFVPARQGFEFKMISSSMIKMGRQTLIVEG